MSVEAFIAIGSNLGDRHAHVESALHGLERLETTTIIACSSVIETEPVGPAGQGPYLNAVVGLLTALPARQILDACLGIEQRTGRTRAGEVRWGPRTLDLDILLFGNDVIDEPGLIVPHPRLHERPFVLTPLAEIAGSVVVPGHDATVDALASRLASTIDAT